MRVLVLDDAVTGDLIAYLRVSTAGQAADGFGLDAQRAACVKWAESAGRRIIAWHADEGASGTLDAVDRPGLSAALAEIGPDTGLLIARLDRLARSLTIQEGILAVAWSAGAAVYSADTGEIARDDPDDPMRTALRQIVGVIAQLDRALIAKRLRDGRRVKAAAGKHAVGAYPYGFRAGGEGRDRDAVPDPTEQEVIGRILSLRASGASYRAVADTLDCEGHPTRYGGSWAATAVRAIVLRAA